MTDIHFTNLRIETRNFQDLLEDLDDTLKSAQRRYLRRLHSGDARAYGPLSEDAENHRKTTIGDYLGTLRSCADVLDQHRQSRLRRSDVTERPVWQVSQQAPRADQLRRRLRTHAAIIRVVMERMRADPSTGLGERDVNDHVVFQPIERGAASTQSCPTHATTFSQSQQRQNLQGLDAGGAYFMSGGASGRPLQATSPSRLPVMAHSNPRALPHPLMIRANELRVVTIDVPSDNSSNADAITVFKSTSSDERFRIVSETTLGPRQGEKVLTPLSIDTFEDRLIPRYALPTMISTVFEMAVFSRNEEVLYKFNSFSDLCSFQTALTGYEVSHDQPAIQCQFSDEVRSFDCTGRVQLWQEPIGPDPAESAHLSRQGSNGSPSSHGTSQSRHDSLASSFATANTVHPTDGGYEAEILKLPAIVIFTQLSDRKNRTRFAMLFIELDRKLTIDTTECRCYREYDTCSKLVLTRGRKHDFEVRALFADTDASGQPDPNTFDLLPFRLPRHPKYSDLMMKRTEYLVLKFSNLPEKKRFDEELRLRIKVREAQIQTQLTFGNRMRDLEYRPPRRRQPALAYQHGPASARADSLSPPVPPSSISLPHHLDIPDSGPGLAASLARSAISPHSRNNSTGEAMPDDVISSTPELNGGHARPRLTELPAVQTDPYELPGCDPEAIVPPTRAHDQSTAITEQLPPQNRAALQAFPYSPDTLLQPSSHQRSRSPALAVANAPASRHNESKNSTQRFAASSEPARRNGFWRTFRP